MVNGGLLYASRALRGQVSLASHVHQVHYVHVVHHPGPVRSCCPKWGVPSPPPLLPIKRPAWLFTWFIPIAAKLIGRERQLVGAVPLNEVRIPAMLPVRLKVLARRATRAPNRD